MSEYTLTGVVIQAPALNIKTIDEMRDHLDMVIASFVGDPADSNYQEGYLACAKELRELLTR